MRRGLLTVALGLATFSGVARAQCSPLPTVNIARSPDSLAIARARQFVRDTMGKYRVPGMSLAIARGGQLVWQEGFGFSDLEGCVATAPITKFRVGSLAKSFTSVAIGQLVEQGKLNLDAEIQAYVPTFPRKRWPVTVRQVAQHLSGIRHYSSDADYLRTKWYPDVLSSLEIFSGDSLSFEPGTRYLYSSFGYNLLGAVIEAASGERYLDYMRRHVFEPMSLVSTVPDFVDSIVPARGRYYEHVEKTRLKNSPFVDNSYKWASGGFLSTAVDLATFGSALLKPTVLKPETVAMLWTPGRLRDGKETTYGIGWGIRRLPDGRRLISHSGGSVGGTTCLQIYPDDGIVVALISNTSEESWICSGAGQIAGFFRK